MQSHDSVTDAMRQKEMRIAFRAISKPNTIYELYLFVHGCGREPVLEARVCVCVCALRKEQESHQQSKDEKGIKVDENNGRIPMWMFKSKVYKALITMVFVRTLSL